MSFKVPNQFRIRRGLMGSDDSIGLCGAFKIPINESNDYLVVIATDGKGSDGTGSLGEEWEHVSVHGEEETGHQFIPRWLDMCKIRDLFWDSDDCVIQYHPPKSEYVNKHKYTLHLWRHPKLRVSLPPKHLIG